MSLTPKVITDTDVYKHEQGYERVFIFGDWDDEHPRRLAQVHIRVDRNPAESFAKVSVWADGWHLITSIPPNDWWEKMPGYLRWTRDDSERKTFWLASELITTLQESGMVL